MNPPSLTRERATPRGDRSLQCSVAHRVLLVLTAICVIGTIVVLNRAGGVADAASANQGQASSSPIGAQDLRLLPGDYHLFTRSGVWVAPKTGMYMVVAVGGGGGGGGGGAAAVGGVSTQVGGAGGSAGGVTINDAIVRAGRRFKISVGKGGAPGTGGSANGGAGGAGGNGGISSFPGVASADGGTGGPGGLGNSSSTVLAPIGAGRSSLGDVQAPGSGGSASAIGGRPSGSSFLYAWPGGGGGGPAGSGRGGGGGGAAGISGTIAAGGLRGVMNGASGGTGSTNRIYTSGAGGGGGGGGAPGGAGGQGGSGVAGYLDIIGPLS
jgi:hypothetical protein